ncbi:UNVERIFIED_CONTAM: hypothetical protein B566_EDAN019286 [Ephemera danica]|nr:hypothetical protein B566_EDAN019286 [Ephemera danica]
MAISSANRAAQPRSMNNNPGFRVLNTVNYSIPACIWCSNKNHGLGGCRGFAGASLPERREFVRKNRRCFACLGKGHFAPDCKSNVKCSIDQCGGRHHSLLHSPPPNPPVIVTNASVLTGGVRLGFVPVILRGPEGEIVTNALLDTGSEVTLVSKKLAKTLKLDGDRCTLNIRMVNGAHTASSEKVTFELASLDREFSVSVGNAFTVDKLPCQKIDQHIDLGKWSHLKDVSLEVINQDEVGLLIGYDVAEAHWVLDQRLGGHNEPHAVRTPFGWSVRGRVGDRGSSSRVFHTALEGMSMEKNLEILYEQEFRWSNNEDDEAPSREDARALKIAETSTKLVDGRFEVGVPWKRDVPMLPDNKIMAKHRAELLRKRLGKDDDLRKRYADTIRTHTNKGYVSEVEPELSERRWYLPHHPVIHPKKPGKVRIVFDCAARYRNTSLNDELLVGPNLNNDLAGVLLRFRSGPVATSADIEEMFLRVRLPERDRWAFSFLWWNSDDLAGKPKVFQWNVHPFGATSSPFCAAYALSRIARNDSLGQPKPWAKAILDNFYVDDCLLASETVDAASEIAVQLTERLAQGGFRLTKWVSNQAEALTSIPNSDRLSIEEGKDLALDRAHHTLGVLWDTRHDTIRIDLRMTTKAVTKRGVLSVVASFFDPLGIVSPILLPGRNFLQRLCRLGLGWDSQIPEEDSKWWEGWLGKLMGLPRIEIPRYVLCQTGFPVAFDLHVFSDASEVGYGAVAYIRTEDPEGNGTCQFVLGKSRVVPSKPITVPRLELTAAVLAVKLKNFVEREVRLNLRTTFLWTDSQLVLRYLLNTTSRFKTFVANRVTFVLTHSTVAQWRHVPTDCNPADLASRGTVKATTEELKLWFGGPTFLSKGMEVWPPMNLKAADISTDVEVKRVAAVTCDPVSHPVLSKLTQRYSTWTRLVRGTAWLKRFVQYMVVMHSNRTDCSLSVGSLQLHEIISVERNIIKMVQEERFEFNTYSSSTTLNIPISHPLSRLKPVLRDGLVCLGGRVSTALALLPHHHLVVDMLIRHYHLACGHMGASCVLTEMRKKYWAVKGMTNVRRVLRSCFVCRAATSRPCGQEMATLPAARIEAGVNPFSVCGVDYFGPFEVKYGRSIIKRYGCLFTCLKTRAVHLEIAHFLSTDSFLMALIRFIGRRGTPEEIYSDNGSNFVGAEAELRRQVDRLDHQRISTAMLERGITWHFNPPSASHRGGVWERMIRTTRRVLTSVAGHQRLTDESLLTFIVETERLINNRPITPLIDDPEQPEALTPNHLLLLRSNSGLATAEVTVSERYTKAWRQAQYLATVFWKRWVKEYLPTLQLRGKWIGAEREVSKGDLVLLMDGTTPYGSWPKGLVSEVLVGHDGHVRDVRIRTPNGEVLRDIRSVCLLEAAFE